LWLNNDVLPSRQRQDKTERTSQFTPTLKAKSTLATPIHFGRVDFPAEGNP